MKRYIHQIYVIAISLILYTSCMGSNDSEVITYSDTAITAFKLTSINRYIHTTTSTGKDTVYKRTLSNPVVFTIDQDTRTIYNPDSLPHDVDATKVLVTISSKNNGTIFVKSVIGDTLKRYNNTDSVNFSKPREVVVYGNGSNVSRSYTVKLNIHQVNTEAILWERKGIEDLPDLNPYIEWEMKVADAGLKEFIGMGRIEAYAFSETGELMVSKDNGATWDPDSIGDDKSMLPTDNVAFVSCPFAANDSTDYQLMVGTNPKAGDQCVVWRKIAEFDPDSDPAKWVRIPVEPYNRYALPAMEDINLIHYNGLIFAIGSDMNFYQSRDKGITWKTASDYILPQELGTEKIVVATDANGYIWLYGKDTGEIWRGVKVE